MSTRNVFFAVPRRFPIEQLVQEARLTADNLEDAPPGVFLLLEPEPKVGDLRWFAFAGAGTRRSFDLEYFLDMLAPAFPGLVVASHDDQNGVFHFAGGEGNAALEVMSDGPYVGVIRGALGIDFPQKRLLPAQLSQERDYWDAVRIGLAQLHPTERQRPYLELEDAIELAGANRRTRVAGLRASPIVDHVPSKRSWDKAGLTFRTY